MEIIAEKTGYPTDMLDLDLDLEADLGIDTVKQAEMFAAIRAAYDIPREDSLKLRDFPTLAHAIKFVYDRRPDLNAVRSCATGNRSRCARGRGPISLLLSWMRCRWKSLGSSRRRPGIRPTCSISTWTSKRILASIP